jgi:hypothetical protein
VAALCFWRTLLGFAWAATAAAGGCYRAAATARDITVQETIAPRPVRVGTVTLSIHLADVSAKPVTYAKISVEADMSHPGMSPVFGTATETSPGLYTAHLNFNMGGDWVVLSHIVLADGRKMEYQIDVSGVEPN